MEYKINTSTKFIPAKQEFMWRDLGLDSVSADIYAVILGFGAWSGKYADFVTMTCTSISTVQRKIDSMVEKGILTRSTQTITGETTRAILVCNYTKDGLRSDYEIKALLNVGLNNLDKYYTTRSANVQAKKNSKKRASKYIEKSDLGFSNDIVVTEELYRHLDI